MKIGALIDGIVRDPLFDEISEMLDICCTEFGVRGCELCNMRVECRRFWNDKAIQKCEGGHRLTLEEQQELILDFKRIKELRMLPKPSKYTGYGVHY